MKHCRELMKGSTRCVSTYVVVSEGGREGKIEKVKGRRGRERQRERVRL
jgi:hypothetical protein